MKTRVNRRVMTLLESKSKYTIANELELLQSLVEMGTEGVRLSERETLELYLELLRFAEKVRSKREEEWEEEMKKRGQVFRDPDRTSRISALSMKGAP